MSNNKEEKILNALNEIIDLLKNVHEEKIRIDVKAFVKELSSGAVNGDIVHLFQWNHRWVELLKERNRRAAKDTYDFIDKEMPNAIFCKDQFEFINSKCKDIISKNEHILDLGVYKGASTRRLANIFPDSVIHGFDSFEGLPGDWSHVLAGTFNDIKGLLPDMPENVILYKGWFEDTLPKWKEKYSNGNISLLRIDCDIYSSTKTIFNTLENMIDENTWIVFDELIGYKGWRNHEHKAFMEFIEKTGFKYEYLAYGLTHAIVRIHR